MFEILATKNDEGRILFKLLIKYLNNVPISKIEKLFRKKDIKVNGKRNLPKDYVVQEGDIIIVYGIEDAQSQDNFYTKNDDLKIIFEDENILVVDKKEGVEIHGDSNCLDYKVLSYLKFKQVDSFKPSHVGRLDKETSGIILYAKTYEALRQLNEAKNLFIKKYLFLSDFSEAYREVEIYISKDIQNKKMRFSSKQTPESKYSKTILTTEGKKKYAKLLTGRKHQIRLALKSINKPIYGDRKYGGKKADRLMLHSYYLQLNGLKDELKYLNKIDFYSLPKW